MRYNQDTCSVELSVRLLCEYAARTGDLGGYGSCGCEAMAEGAEIHRRLQAEAGGFYNSEVTLHNTTGRNGIYYTVSGRADGIIRSADGEVEVDEIKCVRQYEFFSPPCETYLAQLKCYAYLLCVRDGLETVRGRLTYYNVDSKKIKYFRYRLNLDDLRTFYFDLLSKIEGRAKALIFRETVGKPSAAAARFPYPELREGQEIMIRECHTAIKRGRRIFVEAPTGTGKTVSSLYPAVRALGEGHIDKIFYLTAKASTRREAYLASGKLHESGVMLRTVVITAKDQICSCPTRAYTSERQPCEARVCECAKGYYERARAALDELLSEYSGYPRKLICEVAKKYNVCPYELSLDLSEYCDIVICDYNYAFDPSAYFRRYFSDGGKKERYVFLVDEAHNLADRARDMYSAAIRRSDILKLREMIGEADEELGLAADALLMTVGRLRLLCKHDIIKDADGNEQGIYVSREPLASLDRELDIFRKRCDSWLKKNRDLPISRDIEPILSSIRKYLSVSEYFGRGFLCYVELFGGDTVAKIYCLDPSPVMDALLARAKASVLFSATLTPPEYFCDVLGGAKDAYSVTLPSPFDPENLCVTVVDGLSTRAEDRTKNYARYATVIAATVSAKHGNYIAYFPSYECLEGVRKAFCRKYPKVEVVVQSRGMGISEKEAFLSAFKDDAGHLRVGFCVLSGAFSEGVDLPGSRLIGSIVFGVGIPALSNERNIIQEYFDNTVGAGYDYAYTYTGMNHVLQAVGRVIRREGDVGVAVLVDDRYSDAKYRQLFPKHWEGVQYTGDAHSLAEILRRFWHKADDCE